MSFTRELHQRNSLLHIVGWIYLSGAGILLMIIPLFPVEVLGINALIKPTKFLLSSTILVWTAAWLMYYLAAQRQVQIYSWIVVLPASWLLCLSPNPLVNCVCSHLSSGGDCNNGADGDGHIAPP
ncbi:MAG: hypothetical protein AAFN81_27260 [Bacteroidota bacterium]